jgi:hypothetical protein
MSMMAKDLKHGRPRKRPKELTGNTAYDSNDIRALEGKE